MVKHMEFCIRKLKLWVLLDCKLNRMTYSESDSCKWIAGQASFVSDPNATVAGVGEWHQWHNYIIVKRGTEVLHGTAMRCWVRGTISLSVPDPLAFWLTGFGLCSLWLPKRNSHLFVIGVSSDMFRVVLLLFCSVWLRFASWKRATWNRQRVEVWFTTDSNSQHGINRATAAGPLSANQRDDMQKYAKIYIKKWCLNCLDVFGRFGKSWSQRNWVQQADSNGLMIFKCSKSDQSNSRWDEAKATVVSAFKPCCHSLCLADWDPEGPEPMAYGQGPFLQSAN